MSPDENDDTRNSSRDTGSRERAHPPTVTTDEAFEEALQTLVLEADANGVDVRGGWPVAYDDETAMWDIEITRLSRSLTADVQDPGSLVTSIIEAVADREDVEATALPPLQEAIDNDILETLQRSNDERQFVRFQYCGYQITVRADGSLVIEE